MFPGGLPGGWAVIETAGNRMRSLVFNIIISTQQDELLSLSLSCIVPAYSDSSVLCESL